MVPKIIGYIIHSWNTIKINTSKYERTCLISYLDSRCSWMWRAIYPSHDQGPGGPPLASTPPWSGPIAKWQRPASRAENRSFHSCPCLDQVSNCRTGGFLGLQEKERIRETKIKWMLKKYVFWVRSLPSMKLSGPSSCMSSRVSCSCPRARGVHISLQ